MKDGRKQLLAEHKGKGDSSEGGDEPEERESISWDVPGMVRFSRFYDRFFF